MAIRVDHAVTSGTFSLDGGTWEVDNNVWIVGDDEECVIIDAPHDAAAIAELAGGRRVNAILLTHGHDDHISEVFKLAELVDDAPIRIHAADRVVWDLTFPNQAPSGEYLEDGEEIEVAGSAVTVLHTPGHAPGACCFYVADLDTVFSGDTLFAGGPGATGRSYSDFPTIIESIRSTLFTLPDETTVHTGHGDSTSIGAEKPHLQEWVDRGH